MNDAVPANLLLINFVTLLGRNRTENFLNSICEMIPQFSKKKKKKKENDKHKIILKEKRVLEIKPEEINC